MNLKQIEAFYWIARLGSFHAAARHLRVAQPSVSARVRELERHLDVNLFDRSGRNARLTPKGRELMAYAGQMLALAGEVEQQIGSRTALVGRVRFGLTSIPAVTWMPKLLHRMAKAYPGIDAEFVVESSENMRAQLLRGELDVAFLAGPLSEPSLVTESLGAVAMSWLASPSLGLETRPLRPQDLVDVPIITDVRGSFLHGLALEWFRHGGVEPRRQHACSSLPTRLQLARAGLGIAMATPNVAAREIAEGALRLVIADPPLPELEYVIAVAGGARTPTVSVLLELAREAIGEEPRFDIAGKSYRE
ncbi:MAG: LysR family transcriptional regulator [Alphaproteobacteria bacterium]|nr:LysR family transcriptional regulator [Alphaproteobacteria bacterium]